MITVVICLLCLIVLLITNNTKHQRYLKKPRKLHVVATTKQYPNVPKPEWVKNEIVKLKALLGNKAGCRTIAHRFNRLYGDNETVGKTYVANVIANNNYDIMMQRRTIKNKLPRFVAANDTWAMDISFYTTANTITQPFLGVVDHGSRKLLSLHTIINKSSWTLLGYLCIAIGKYGKPKKLRTDNEMIFTSFVFRTFLKVVNIQHQRIPTASPWCNGRIERLFGTLKPMVKLFKIHDKAALQTWLNQFKYWYNYHRPHQNLNGKTPEDIWRKRRRK